MVYEDPVTLLRTIRQGANLVLRRVTMPGPCVCEDNMLSLFTIVFGIKYRKVWQGGGHVVIDYILYEYMDTFCIVVFFIRGGLSLSAVDFFLKVSSHGNLHLIITDSDIFFCKKKTEPSIYSTRLQCISFSIDIDPPRIASP